jgi:hypothetical protein
MFGDGPLTFQEFATREPLPLATVHDAVLEFLRGRDDAVLCGAHAVKAYVDEPRMTQDVDVVSPRAAALAEEVGRFLHERFDTAVCVRDVGEGRGYRIAQERQPKNRHLVDVRSVNVLPPARRVTGVLVVTPPELIANKVCSMVRRQHTPKAGQDMADLYRLLLAFPDLKIEGGPVAERLHANGAKEAVMAVWKNLVAREILPEGEDEKFRAGADENE